MNAFKQLEKRAELTNPYVQQTPAPAGPQKPKGTGLGWMAADAAIGMIPVVGGLWNGGRALYHASQGNWGDAAANGAMAGLGLVGLGAAGAAARVGTAGAKLGWAARAGTGIANAATKGGVIGNASKGIMRAGELTNSLKAAGPTVFKGARGFGPGGFAKVGPITGGQVANAGVNTAAVVAPSVVLPDGTKSPNPYLTNSPYAQQINAPSPQQFTGSSSDWLADQMSGGRMTSGPGVIPR